MRAAVPRSPSVASAGPAALRAVGHHHRVLAVHGRSLRSGGDQHARRPFVEVGTRVEIVAYIMRGTPLESITAGRRRTSSAFPEVLAVDYVDEEQALAQAQAELVEFRDAYRDLRVNPLPPPSRFTCARDSAEPIA